MASFSAFIAAVEASCTKHAARKGYTRNSIDGPNQLMDIAQQFGVHEAHCIGEILYKLKEFQVTEDPEKRKILLEKVAGWTWILYRSLDAAPSCAAEKETSNASSFGILANPGDGWKHTDL